MLLTTLTIAPYLIAGSSRFEGRRGRWLAHCSHANEFYAEPNCRLHPQGQPFGGIGAILAAERSKPGRAGVALRGPEQIESLVSPSGGASCHIHAGSRAWSGLTSG